MQHKIDTTQKTAAHFAGLLYLIIIVFGIGAEVALRGPLIDLANASGTAEAILNSGGAFGLSIAADLVMAIADAGLAILLWVLFRSVAPGLALAAMVFRLIQSVLIGANLMNMQAAWLLISGGQDVAGLGAERAEAMATLFLNLHAHGYDLGLVFFGINSVMTGLLIWRSGFVPKLIGAGLALAGGVYLMGSGLHFFAPAAYAAFAPAYGLTVLAEAAFCIWLLLAFRSQRRLQAA